VWQAGKVKVNDSLTEGEGAFHHMKNIKHSFSSRIVSNVKDEFLDAHESETNTKNAGTMMICTVELCPPTGLLYTTKVISQHGDHGGMISTVGKLKIHPPKLSGNPTSSYLVASRRNGRRKV
jgi:hypothetical protein